MCGIAGMTMSGGHCPSGQEAIDGTARVSVPAVAGSNGASSSGAARVPATGGAAVVDTARVGCAGEVNLADGMRRHPELGRVMILAMTVQKTADCITG